MSVTRLADALIEAPVVTSFTRLGYDLRSRLGHWTPLDDYRLDGQVIVLTGATSGLGLAGAEQLARCGATVVLLGRNRDKTEQVRHDLATRTGNPHLDTVVADMGDLDAVRRVADEIGERYPVVHTLIHNAGALSATRRTSPQGIEATVASQVVGPFLLTSLLFDNLRAALPGRVITMSSGGMYATGLRVHGLEMDEADYRGAEQYARAKRAQVTLNELWAARIPPSEVVFHAVHPGWADTPGVEESLPTFRRIVGPLLRTPGQGADTMVWLAADDGEPLHHSGAFWLDRARRPIHKLPTTSRTDNPTRRAELWDWCSQQAGLAVG